MSNNLDYFGAGTRIHNQIQHLRQMLYKNVSVKFTQSHFIVTVCILNLWMPMIQIVYYEQSCSDIIMLESAANMQSQPLFQW